MKTRLSHTPLVVVAGTIFCLPFVLAADTNEASSPEATAPAAVETGAKTATAAAAPAPATTPARDSAAVKLPYGVDDVLKLSRAQISEDVTLNYIQNSGTIYGLSANDIVFLKNQGVSDKVINAMQDQRKRAMESTAQATAATAVQVYSATPATPTAPVYVQQPIYVQEPFYAEPIAVAEPEPEPASTLYVIPYPTQTYPRYTYASSYPRDDYSGSYAFYGGPAPFRPAAYGPALRGGPGGGVYHFGGGRGAGATRSAGSGHATGGARSHSGHHR